MTRSARWNNLVLFAGTFHFALAYTLILSPSINLTAFAAGQVRAPYQYRALTAWIFAAANRFFILPASLMHHHH